MRVTVIADDFDSRDISVAVQRQSEIQMNQARSGAHIELSPEQLSVFRRAASILTSSLELNQALANTIAACLPALGDFGFFDVTLGDGVRRTALAYADPDLDALLKGTSWNRQERKDINLCALSSGEAVLHANTDDAWYAHAFGDGPRALAFRSMLTVPVRSGSELIGALTLFMAASGRNHTHADLRFAEELAGLAAPIVVNARLQEQQRQAQQALKISEERLRLATDAGKIGIWDWDIPNNVVSWSDRVYELHGLPKGMFGGRVEDFAALIHPDDRQAAREGISAAIASGNTFSNDFRIAMPDGSVRWLSTWAYVHRDQNGVAVRMVGSTMDITAQKATEAGLTDLNAELEQRVVSSLSERDRIWGMSQDILAVASFGGYFISVSPAFTTILGWDEQEAISTPFMNLAHPDQRDELTEVLGKLAQGTAIDGFEIQSLHKDGSFRWLSWTIVAEGKLLYGVGRDVTELRKQREQILSASEMRLQLALKVGGMGAWQWDMRSGHVIWWPGMDALHGLPAGTTLTHVQDYLQFIHPEDIDLVKQSFQDAAKPNSGQSREYRVVWPDGSVHWIEGRSEVSIGDDGASHHLAGICVDITLRKRTEQNLRFLAQASSELAELVDHEETLRRVARLAVPSFADWCSVDILDELGELKRVAVAHVDPAKVTLAHELHDRYPPDPDRPNGTWQIIRTGQSELVPEIPDEMLAASIKDPMYLGIIRELGLRSYIGVPLTVRGKTLGVLTFISAESKRIYGTGDIALAEDIGRRAAVAIENSVLYRSLKDADRRKDDFLAMLAHELRNPLAPIKAAADLLKLPLAEKPLKKTSEVISRQVDHMTGLVDDLLDVSRVTRGHVVIENSPVDLKRVVNAAIEQVRPLIESKLHHLTVSIGSGPLFVDGDEKRLVQVAANLLNNAAKYTSERGNIELRVGALPDFIEICVSDDGMGMEPELVANAFDLFVQGKRGSDRGQGGLGLGLALVKSLVELHGGSVRAFSAGQGKGSKFVVRLSRSKASINQDVAAAPSQMPAQAERPLRILVVDDNIDAAQMLVLFLQAIGHAVSVSHDPIEAIRIGNQMRFDVILVDIGLPGMDGYELACHFRAQSSGKGPALVAISGYGQDQDRAKAEAAGISHYLIKPVNTTKLSRILSDIPPHDVSATFRGAA